MASSEQEKEELDRILQSSQFCKAPRLQKFLSVVCEYYFRGKADQINEFLLGVEAFGKKADFNVAEDSIVRVEAREVRRRLREYYQNGGRNSTLVLNLPIGGYCPRFIPAGKDVPAKPKLPKIAHLPGWARILGLVVAVSLASFGSWKLFHRTWAQETSSNSAGRGPQEPLVPAFWNRFLADGDSTIIVLSNPPVFRFVGAGDPPELRSNAIRITLTPSMLGSLADEIKTREALLLTPALDQYTGVGEAMALYSIASTFRGGGRVIVKQSRTLSADDLKHHNLILLGGSAVNLWSGKLGQTLDFLGEQGSVTNLRTQKGEQSRYVISVFDPKTGALTSDYAVVALQRSSATGHWVLLLFGGHSEGTQAAAEAMTDESFLRDLLERMRASTNRSSSFPDSFQVLLSVKVDNGIPAIPEYVAHHVP